jgi:hypothetical protein
MGPLFCPIAGRPKLDQFEESIIAPTQIRAKTLQLSRSPFLQIHCLHL